MRVADLAIGDIAITIMWEPSDDHDNVYEIRQFLGKAEDGKGSVRTWHINARDVGDKTIVLFKHESVETYSAFGMSKPPNDINPKHYSTLIKAVFQEAFSK